MILDSTEGTNLKIGIYPSKTRVITGGHVAGFSCFGQQ
jgi:hypothetical protein